ncbi:hypothetical protein [Hyalangium sp.]|uniref:hypothetical protein n=1 Tax=Hyalangium sp. TaxID=2028555 RepID=UPI002D65454A|nr:hypothetical protein [Hyalangium sp.]HYH98163.1 hypothetical protein [Hyalangium sp.]
MKVLINGKRYSIPSTHAFALAIESLAKDYTLNKASRAKGGGDEPPERNDVKQLWRDISSKHKALLRAVAKRPGGASQADLETDLGLQWQELRGVHNGLARICERLGVEKPVRTTGYNATNRTYLMDPDIAHTVRNLVKRDSKS